MAVTSLATDLGGTYRGHNPENSNFMEAVAIQWKRKGAVHATATFTASGYVVAVVSVFIFVADDVVVVFTGAAVLCRP